MADGNSRAVRISRHGGPEVLALVEIPALHPGPGEVLVRQHAAGVNMIDIYQREGESAQYRIPLPAVLGVEGAGVVEAVGEGVAHPRPGDRVAYLMTPGAYAERRLIAAEKLVALPDAIGFDEAAALMIKGSTAWYLLHKVWQTRGSDTILVHSAAGGVGMLLCQWALRLGARVIAATGSAGKIGAIRDLGVAEVIDSGREDVPARVRDLTGGRGVDVVFDPVGRDTFAASLRCLRPLGLMVSFGQSSGPVPPFDLADLARNGSIFLAKPTLATFTTDPALLREMTAGLFAAVEEGLIAAQVTRRVTLEELAEAHRDIAARRTTGAVIVDLAPD